MTRRTTFILSTLMALTFGVCSYLAVLRNSPTIDEPICALSGYLYVVDGDLRFDVDNPPLWKYWATIPNLGRDLMPVAGTAGADAGNENGFLVSTRRLFQTPGNDGIAFVNRSRAMLLVFGVLLAGAIAVWSWQIAGGLVATIAGVLFCLDPNFLGHAPLVKADVLIALLMFCISWATWSVGKQARIVNVALLCLLCGVAVTVKYNGIPLAFIPPFLLFFRALAPAPLVVLGRSCGTRISRMVAIVAITLAAVASTWAMIWACYQFRYAPSRSGQRLDLAGQVYQLTEARLTMRNGFPPTPEQVRSEPAPLVARAVMFLDRHRVFPQAWLYGLVSIYRSSTTVYRQSYLLGEVSMTGWWYYFPLAMLFKTPLATLAAVLLGSVVLVVFSRRAIAPQIDRWTILCLAVPTAMYALASLTSNTNAGLRHVLPLYPPIFLFVGVSLAKVKSVHPRLFWTLATGLGLGLAIETLAAFPHYISFFNAVARPQRLYLLSDSNFDWGQDLSYVAEWRRSNPDVPLYLAYWGPVDPAYYGIEHAVLPGGFTLGRTGVDVGSEVEPIPPRRRVVIVGATLLQGSNSPPALRDFYRPFLHRQPQQILGDTMYLYDWPLR